MTAKRSNSLNSKQRPEQTTLVQAKIQSLVAGTSLMVKRSRIPLTNYVAKTDEIQECWRSQSIPMFKSQVFTHVERQPIPLSKEMKKAVPQSTSALAVKTTLPSLTGLDPISA